MKIQNIYAREIFDSRGIPTIECDLLLSDGVRVTSSVPSGISRGKYEAAELRDGGDRLQGLGVKKAVAVIKDIITPVLVGRVPDVVTCDIELLDLDSTDDKSRLGANAMLAVSIAVCKAQAYVEGVDLYEFIAQICEYSSVALPYPMFNLFEGGLHANNNFHIQELLIVPTKELSFHAAMDTGVTVYHELQNILAHQNKSTTVGYEGGFVSSFENEFEAFDTVMHAIENVGKQDTVMLAIDVAASHLYDHETGKYRWFGGNVLTTQELINKYQELSERYPLYSIEDGLCQLDWNGWVDLKHTLKSRVKLVGDDLFVTDAQRIWQGIESDCATTVLIKPNQIGTITETLQAIKLCKDSDWDVIISHRSGETNDSFIADLAVGVSAGHIKAGGCSRGERMAKYNRLLQIEHNLMSV